MAVASCFEHTHLVSYENGVHMKWCVAIWEF